MSRKSIAAVLATLILTACGTAPPLQTLQPVHADGHSLGRSAMLDKTDHMTKHVDQDKNVLYFQNFGGSAGVGILFGPIGMMANMAMIESKTKDEVAIINGKMELKPRDLFAQAAQQQGFKLAEAGKGAQLTPYLYVSKLSEDKVAASAALIVEHPAQGTAAKWVGKYMVQLPNNYTFEQLKDFDQNKQSALTTSTADAFNAIIAHMMAEKQERIAAEAPITFRSPVLTPRFDFDLTGTLVEENADVIWVRTVGGVYALRKADVTYTVVKKS